MKIKIPIALIIVAVLVVASAATLGYFRIHTDEQHIAASAPTDKQPSILLGTLDGAYLLEVRLLARAGNAAAQTVLGARYQYGLGAPKNVALMLQNYRAAATTGDQTAQLMLGRLYDPYQDNDFMTLTEPNLDSVIKSPSGEILLTANSTDAKNWYQKAANKGNVAAMVMLGVLFEKEERKADDYIVKAAEWFQRAAENGNLYGELNIGEMYVGGYGVNQDEDKGIMWLQKAAAQGSVEAELDLGVEYENGSAMLRDSQKAAKWYLLAARHGNSSAQRDIGMLYAKGKGVPRDYVEAYVWLDRAAAHDAPSAANARDSLESLMSPGQLEAAQRKASLKVD